MTIHTYGIYRVCGDSSDIIRYHLRLTIARESMLLVIKCKKNISESEVQLSQTEESVKVESTVLRKVVYDYIRRRHKIVCVLKS